MHVVFNEHKSEYTKVVAFILFGQSRQDKTRVGTEQDFKINQIIVHHHSRFYWSLLQYAHKKYFVEGHK